MKSDIGTRNERKNLVTEKRGKKDRRMRTLCRLSRMTMVWEEDEDEKEATGK